MASANSRHTRQTRCERCILSHRPCDGKQPICTTCSTHRAGPKSCVYPPGQPSRSELKKIKIDEAKAKVGVANARKVKLAEQAANRKAAGITYGFGKGLYGTVPDSWPERFGGKGGYEKMIAEKEKRSGKDGGLGTRAGGHANVDNDGIEPQNEIAVGTNANSSADEEERPKKRRRKSKFNKTKAHVVCDISSGSEVEIDIRTGFPSLLSNALPAGPAEDTAPRAPSLGTSFDPHANPDWYNRTRKSPEEIKEMLCRLASSPHAYFIETSVQKKEADDQQQR